MRIIAGKYKGRIIGAPKGVRIRPTKDMVKEALFNILGAKICGSAFLELFAGSGSVGIEALSRGANKVFLVENNRFCLKAIEKNLEQLKLAYAYGMKAQQAKRANPVIILPLDAEKAIELLQRKGEKFDVVFLDPPYVADAQKNILIKISLYDILKPHSFLIAEHSATKILPQQLARLKLMFTKGYGDAALSFYQN